jgi:hypothetical protein
VTRAATITTTTSVPVPPLPYLATAKALASKQTRDGVRRAAVRHCFLFASASRRGVEAGFL